MTWTAEHFNGVAAVIRVLREDWDNDTLDAITLRFALYFQVKDENFNSEKFIAACGYRA